MAMYGRPRTVFDRMQQNGGFLEGPNHARRKAGMMMGEKEPEKAEGTTPPNLRDSAQEVSMCGTCMHYAAMKCKKYGDTSVVCSDVCDGYERAGAEPAEEPVEDEEEVAA